MRSTQRPSTQDFLIRLPAGQSEAGRLSRLGDVEPVAGSRDLLLHLREPSDEPRTIWRQIVTELGPGSMASPVLVDELGQAHLPTGEISVRFHTEPSDEALRQFAARHGLAVRERNKYVPRQVCFEPSESSYLPDLVQELAPSKEVETVWANTLSRFRRV